MNRTDIELIARKAVADCINERDFVDLDDYKRHPFELDCKMFDMFIREAIKEPTLPQETRDDILQDIDECYADEDDKEFIVSYCRLYWEYEIDPDEIAEELFAADCECI